MSNVSRICPQCGESTPLESRHCAHCGYDANAGLPLQTQSNLPMVIGKAALPVLAGVASLALRLGWKMMRSRMAQDAMRYGATKAASALVNARKTPLATTSKSPAPLSQSELMPKAKRTIRIRSSWAVGDANGIRQQGSSDHTIEFDD